VGQSETATTDLAPPGFGFSTILLEGLPPERPRTWAMTKTYLLLRFEGPGTQSFCGGIIARGGHFCMKMDCGFSTHCTKAWDGGTMEPDFYIVDAMAQKTFLEPFLPLANGMWSRTGQSILANGEQPLEFWVAVFRHLQDASRTSEEENAAGDGAGVYFTEEHDTGLQRFTTAMKSRARQGVLNPLASPKRL
jgi:hypothetical protein